MWDSLIKLIHSAADDVHFPPTVLYNENWMLRLVLDCIVDGGPSSLLPVAAGAKWYSEAQLRSAFLPRYRRDPLAESYTHADGVVGHFHIGRCGTTDLEVLPEAKQLTVLEGKVFSKLSPGVSNARYFDQAARSVACMAEVLRASNVPPDAMEHLSFHLVAPRIQIESGIFGRLVTRPSMEAKVRRRVAEYEGARDDWLKSWFLPVLRRVEVSVVS